MKRVQIIVLLIAISAAGAAMIDLRMQPLVIYNPSPSVPPGFYVRASSAPQIGDLVTVRAADTAFEYATLRGFADATDRFIKRVVAISGHTVCAEGESLSIDGRHAAMRMRHDTEGRALPTWRGCRTLITDEVFLLGDTEDSFDGRYWGATPLDAIDGVWIRL